MPICSTPVPHCPAQAGACIKHFPRCFFFISRVRPPTPQADVISRTFTSVISSRGSTKKKKKKKKNDGLKVSVEVIYMRLTFAHVGRSTNARFIESLDSKYKSSIDRVQESRRDNSDDEDEDALFAELEAEIENADSAKLRDKGVKEMQAQFVGFYLFDP